MTSGSYTVGSGGDYANWAAAAAATENLTGNLTFTQISDVTDNTALAFNVALGGYTLTLTSNKRHNGNFGGGWKTTLSMNLSSSTAIMITNSSTSAGAKFNVNNLNLLYTGTVTSFGLLLDFASATTNITNTVNDCIANANSKPVSPFRSSNDNNVLKIYNCVSANGGGTGTQYAFGFNFNGIHSSSVLENSTAYGFTKPSTGNAAGVLNYKNQAMIYKNVASFGNTTSFQNASFTGGIGSNVTATKCASSDTYGSEAGLRSLADTAQFQSVTITDGDLFLKIKSTGVLDDGGVAPSIAANTTGIRGTARPHDVNKYSIGADEFKSTRPSVSIDGAPATHNGLSPFEITIEFSEEVVGFAVGDIGATNAELSGFAGSGDTYTVTVTPDGEDDITLSIAENVAVDLYANGNTAAEDVEVSYAAPGECCIGDSRLAVGIGIGF